MAVTHAWKYHCRLTINHTKVPADVTNLPVLVIWTGAAGTSNMPQGMVDADSGYAPQSGGEDIRFTTDPIGQNEVPFEIVVHSLDNNPANSSVEIHVLLASVSSSVDTVFYMWWGNPGASPYANNATFGRNNVWTDYAAVWHLQSLTNGSATTVDSSGNAATNGTPTTLATTAAQIKNGYNYDADGDKSDVPAFAAARTLALITAGHGFAFEQWVKPTDDWDSNGGQRRPLVSKGLATTQDWTVFAPCNEFGQGNSVMYESDDTSGNQSLATNNTTWNANSLYFLCLRVSASGSKTYKWSIWENGSVVAGETQKTYTNALSNSSTGNADVMLGYQNVGSDRSLRGWQDELRISKVTRDDNWFTTSFNVQNSPQAFVTQQGIEVWHDRFFPMFTI